MLKLSAFIFDLDGTLLNTLEDIADAENSVLKELKLPPRPVDDYRLIVGGGAENIAKKLLPEGKGSESDLSDFVSRFRTYYQLNWHAKTRPYTGIPELLKAILEKGFPLAVLSNKPEEFTLQMVDFFFPDWQEKTGPITFTHVLGQNRLWPVKPDPAQALRIARDWDLSPDRIGLVGDSDVDMFTASNAGMLAIGAEWGFRGREELVSSGADIILEKPEDLLEYLE